MLNPWIINNSVYNNCILAFNMNLKNKTNKTTSDYTLASYNRPMVLLFTDNTQAKTFTLKHASGIGRTSVIMKDRGLPHSINTQVASSAEMVLIQMPKKALENSTEELHVLDTQQLNAIGDDIMLNLAVVSYALFYYIENFYENENHNLTLNGIVINPLLEVDDDMKRDVIMRYLHKMYSN